MGSSIAAETDPQHMTYTVLATTIGAESLPIGPQVRPAKRVAMAMVNEKFL